MKKINLRTLTLLLVMSVTTLLFQNCSPVALTDMSTQVLDQSGNPVDPKDLVVQKQTFDVRFTPEIDILFVVDNSGSMKEEQQNISSKINGFMQLISNLQWHVAVTTTDPNRNTKDANGTSRPWGDGQFRPFDSDSGSLYVLKHNEHSIADAQAKLSQAFLMGTNGNGSERAINSTYRAIERIKDTAGSQQFFRPNARLVVITISDEDECSNGNCSGNVSNSNPTNLINLVQNQFSSSKVFVFNSIIRAPSDTSCTTAENNAPIYESLSKKTGGIIGSICATDYTAILSSMGQGAVALAKSINLQCAPVDTNADGTPDVALVNESNGQFVSTGYSISGTTATFSAALPEGTYSAVYTCVK